MAAGEESGEGQRRNAESLGWLTESTIMPKKQRVIEGVGASTIVNLRAQLYKSQEEMKMAAEGGEGAELLRAKKKGDLFSHTNSGVAERDHRSADSWDGARAVGISRVELRIRYLLLPLLK